MEGGNVVFDESEKLQLAIAYASSKVCDTPKDFLLAVNAMLNELSPKTNALTIDTGSESSHINTDDIIVQYPNSPDLTSASVGIFSIVPSYYQYPHYLQITFFQQ